MEKETHYDRILRHLRDYGSITSWEAFEEYGNTRLSATIFNLRQDGYNIISEKVGKKNRYGKFVYFAKYTLKEKKFKVRDRVLAIDKLGKKWKATIININEFREPSMKYCLDLDDYDEDYVFVGENQIQPLEEK